MGKIEKICSNQKYDVFTGGVKILQIMCFVSYDFVYETSAFF